MGYAADRSPLSTQWETQGVLSWAGLCQVGSSAPHSCKADVPTWFLLEHTTHL